MKLDIKNIFDWRVERVSKPQPRYVKGFLVGYVVRVKYIHHGRRSYSFNIPKFCDVAFAMPVPRLAAERCYNELKAKMNLADKNKTQSR